MDIQNLRAFHMVAGCGSFSTAATALHITQPAVSKRVALLEEQVGAVLFDRIGRNVSLTEAGGALLPHAEAILLEIRAGEQSVRDLAGTVSGRLRLATSHHIGLHRLPPVLSRFKAGFPEVEIDIEFMDSEQAYELIAKSRAELAVVTLAPATEASIVTVPVWEDPLDFMAAPDHPLAAEKNLDLATFSAHPAVLPGLNTYTGQIVKRLFDLHQLGLQVSMVTNYLETIRMLASVGLGWTVLPRSMGDDSLISLKVRDTRIERTLGLVYHRRRTLSRAARAFIELLLAAGSAAPVTP